MSSSLNCICSASDVFILRVIRCIYIQDVIARRLIKVLPTQSKLPVIQNNLPYPNRICEYDNPDCLLLNRSLDFSHPVYLLLGSFINVCQYCYVDVLTCTCIKALFYLSLQGEPELALEIIDLNFASSWKGHFNTSLRVSIFLVCKIL